VLEHAGLASSLSAVLYSVPVEGFGMICIVESAGKSVRHNMALQSLYSHDQVQFSSKRVSNEVKRLLIVSAGSALSLDG